MIARVYVRVKLSCYRIIEYQPILYRLLYRMHSLKRKPHYTQDKCTIRFHHKNRDREKGKVGWKRGKAQIRLSWYLLLLRP